MDETRKPTIDKPEIAELTIDKLESVTGGDLLFYMISYAVSHCDCIFPTILRK